MEIQIYTSATLPLKTAVKLYAATACNCYCFHVMLILTVPFLTGCDVITSL